VTTLFHGRQNESRSSILELPAPLQPGLLAANPRVFNLYLAAQGLPSRIHHRPAEFVKHHPRSLVIGKTELTLQEQGKRPDAQPAIGSIRVYYNARRSEARTDLNIGDNTYNLLNNTIDSIWRGPMPVSDVVQSIGQFLSPGVDF
jgi:hypothetical protein